MNITGLAHIAVYTEDIENSIAFYDKLGGECYARGSVQKNGGENKLAMLRFADFELELIEPGDGTVIPHVEGAVPHFALEIEDLPMMIDALKMMDINSFRTDEINVRPTLFGGLQNIFLAGPSGEMIELIEHFHNPV